MSTLIVTALMLIGMMVTTPADARDTGEMLPLLKRHEIQVLLAASFSPTQIAERLGVSLDTVRRVGAEAPVDHVDDDAEHHRRKIGRPSKANPYADAVRAWLAEEPELPTQELLRRAMLKGYTGRKSAFYELVASARPPRGAPVVRFEGLPGEFSQHDFGHVDVRFVDGRSERVHFFASRLKYSRFVAVSLVPNEQVETLVRTLVRHFVAFGGVPLLAVFDRPRTIVARGGRGRAVDAFNTTFAQVMLELGVGAEMCAPRSGNQKGAVEQVVKWVKNTFFKWRKFVDAHDLEAQLAAWHHEVNTVTPSRATGEIPEARRQQELARLRPVRVSPEQLALRVPIVVGPTAEVAFEGCSYSMPPRAAHITGTAFVYEKRIRFVAGRFEAEHTRGQRGDAPVSLSEHRAQKIAAVHGARAVLYEKRQQLLNLGADALTLMTALFHRSHAQGTEDVVCLYALFEQHGEAAMRDAFARVVAKGTLTVEAVHELLAPVEAARARASRSRAATDGTTTRGYVTTTRAAARKERGR